VGSKIVQRLTFPRSCDLVGLDYMQLGKSREMQQQRFPNFLPHFWGGCPYYGESPINKCWLLLA